MIAFPCSTVFASSGVPFETCASVAAVGSARGARNVPAFAFGSSWLVLPREDPLEDERTALQERARHGDLEIGVRGERRLRTVADGGAADDVGRARLDELCRRFVVRGHAGGVVRVPRSGDRRDGLRDRLGRRRLHGSRDRRGRHRRRGRRGDRRGRRHRRIVERFVRRVIARECCQAQSCYGYRRRPHTPPPVGRGGSQPAVRMAR